MTILNFVTQQLPSGETFSLELESTNGFEVEILDVLDLSHTLHNVSSIEWNVETGYASFVSKRFNAAHRPQTIFLKEVKITFAVFQADHFIAETSTVENAEVYASY